MNLYKINKKYSLFLFFFSLLFLTLVSEILERKNILIPFQAITCFFLISIIGVSHGALDHLKGYKIIKFYGIKNKYYFYPIYVFFSLTVIILWGIFPSLTLFLFLIVASYHFGKEDSSIGSTIKKRFISLLFFLKGSVVILAPLLFHTEETIKIFETLNVNLTISYDNLFIILLILSFLSNFYIIHWTNSGGFLMADWLTILILNLSFSPLVAFTIYFCFLHSVRHSFALIYDLNKDDFNKGLEKFIKKALPLTIITAILFIVSAYFLTNYYVLNDAILKVIFIGLASLTFPHILLEYLLEKNEK
jgi:Brp/Blh family beta-carotene 15,15'-monooxygenase